LVKEENEGAQDITIRVRKSLTDLRSALASPDLEEHKAQAKGIVEEAQHVSHRLEQVEKSIAALEDRTINQRKESDDLLSEFAEVWERSRKARICEVSAIQSRIESLEKLYANPSLVDIKMGDIEKRFLAFQSEVDSEMKQLRTLVADASAAPSNVNGYDSQNPSSVAACVHSSMDRECTSTEEVTAIAERVLEVSKIDLRRHVMELHDKLSSSLVDTIQQTLGSTVATLESRFEEMSMCQPHTPRDPAMAFAEICNTGDQFWSQTPRTTGHAIAADVADEAFPFSVPDFRNSIAVARKVLEKPWRGCTPTRECTPSRECTPINCDDGLIAL
jgi:hypothetical protein